jgi:disulfide bond formation protein DsbB
LRPFIEKITSLPLAAQLLLVGNFGALLFALTMQYVFGVLPCYLCIWERIPYASVAGISLLVLVWKPYGRHAFLLLGLCVLVYLGSAGLSFFHTGVERLWWEGTPGCVAQPLQGASLEEIRQNLLKVEEPRCDVIPWSIFGLSLANLNVLASLVLAFFTAIVAKQARVRT